MRRTQHVVALYDISSNSVAGAHVLYDASTAILAAARSDALIQESTDSKRLVDDTVRHLEDVSARIHKADTHHPSFVQVMLSSPWYRSQTRNITYRPESPFVCSEKLVESLIAKEIDHILANEEGVFGAFGTESIIVEKQLSQIKLNGYVTLTPYGKRATTLDLFFTVTIAPKPVLDRFTDILRRSYGTRRITFTTAPFAAYIAMRDALPIEDECLVIDIGEEVTDVAFIKEGIFLYQHSFPVGTHALYRTLAEGGAHTLAETRAILATRDKLSDGARRALDEAIGSYSTQWQQAFRSVLDGGAYGFCLPSTCIIFAELPIEDIISTVLRTDPFIKHSCLQGAVSILRIDESLFRDKVHNVDGTPIDIAIGVGALFTQQVLG